jgi:hypothetical protein
VFSLTITLPGSLNLIAIGDSSIIHYSLRLKSFVGWALSPRGLLKKLGVLCSGKNI